ncbi:polysaccharide biosynthesis/export family protein [Desulfococcaceae bacterium HSG9]|nr:polysaccharide biosynthesis/export family protein [Desulfococcaceae bacterium HSG9]
MNNSIKLTIIAALIIGVFLFIGGCGEPRIVIPSKAIAFKNTAKFIPASYRIGQGDELEILYYNNPNYVATDYIIDSEDVLRINFYYYPVLSKTVRVRPDGFVTLPRIGDIKVIGIKPRDLAVILQKRYAPYLSRPNVTVEATQFNVRLNKIKEAVTTTTRGQSKKVTVTPDGKIALPFIQKDISVLGLTTFELARDIEKMLKFAKGISITVALLRARSNRVYIMGQVQSPDYYELMGPTTLTQLIATAGGFTAHANTHQVVHITRSKSGRPLATVIDMDDIIGKGNLANDPYLRQHDVIFVSRTTISQAALVGEAIWQLIPVGFSGSVGYDIGP